jgi:hypothetical protein
MRKQLRHNDMLNAGAASNRTMFSVEGIDQITWSIRQMDAVSGAYQFELKISHDGIIWSSLSTPSVLTADGVTSAAITVFAAKMGCIEVSTPKGSTSMFAVSVYGEGVESNLMPGGDRSSGGYEVGV